MKITCDLIGSALLLAALTSIWWFGGWVALGVNLGFQLSGLFFCAIAKRVK